MPHTHNATETDLRDLVRGAGLRCTSARLAVLGFLRQSTSPLSHAEIAEALVPRGLDKATVFRNLVDLAEAGLVSRSELGDHVWRYELLGVNGSENGRHPHFVCVDCGTVTCLNDAPLDNRTGQQAAQVGRITEILLKGHCNDCQ